MLANSDQADACCQGDCRSCCGCSSDEGSSTLAIAEHPATARAVRLISEYPFSQVREKILLEEALSPTRVDEAIPEFRKYLMLIALGYREVGMISPEVDEVWHTFILFTRDYAEFCEEVFGFFLHHQPSLPSRPLGVGGREKFLEAYRQEFGEVPAIWGATSDCSPDTGGGGNECSPVPSCSGDPNPT